MPAVHALVLMALAFQQDAPPILELRNNSYDVVEFRIRASDRGREWTIVRCAPWEAGKSIRLISEDPFDIEICRWSGQGYWFVSEAHAIHLKKSRFGWHQITMDRWLATPTGDKANPTFDFGEMGSHLAEFNSKNERLVVWPVELRHFRLLDRGQ